MNYNQTLIVPNGIEHWEPRITGLEVYSSERGGIILKPTEMGVAACEQKNPHATRATAILCSPQEVKYNKTGGA